MTSENAVRNPQDEEELEAVFSGGRQITGINRLSALLAAVLKDRFRPVIIFSLPEFLGGGNSFSGQNNRRFSEIRTDGDRHNSGEQSFPLSGAAA